MTFARTKIQPPRPRTDSIDRGVLELRLAAALSATRVSLLCAPAGYGKTTLLARALSRLPAGHAVAWFSADEGDGLQDALECLLAALEPFDPPWRSAPETLLTRVADSDAEQRAVASDIINTLDACEVPHGVLVLDDLHRIEDPAFFRFLDVLVARMSRRWSFALASRVEPPLALARLRANGELAEFRQLQLRFALEEARRLAAATGIDLARADPAFERTQGWPAGLRMALGAADQPAGLWSARDSERSIFSFLLTEVLESVRPELADFLLAASVLPELDAERCALVSGKAHAAALIDEVEQLGLLTVALDAPTPVLRLHDLLREALQQHLAVNDPARLRELRRHAAASEPDALRRIALLIAADAFDEAAQLVLATVPDRLARHGPAGALHLLAAFPPPVRERSPELMLVRGLIGWVGWEFTAMRELFERARRAFEAAGNEDGASLAAAYHAHGLIMTGRLAEAGQLLAGLKERATRIETRALTLNALYWIAIDQGRFDAVAPLYGEQVDLLQGYGRADLTYQTSPPLRLPGAPGITRHLARHAELMLRVNGDEPTPLRPLGILSQAWVAAWHGDLAEARRLRELARAEAAWSGSSGAVVAHLLTHAAFERAMSGDHAGAIAAARERVQRQAHVGAWGRCAMAALLVRVTAACDDLTALRDALAEARDLMARLRAAGTPFNEPVIETAAAQLAWLEGRTAEAVAGWEQALRNPAAIDHYGQATETRVRLARAKLRAHDLPGAAALVAQVLAAGRREQGPGGALLAGEALRELAAAAWGTHLAAADVALLRRWLPPREAAVAVPAIAGDAELSAREMEVLARIAAGESNKLIARALDLSLHTVKRHVANILNKLGTETRGQAAAMYNARQG